MQSTRLSNTRRSISSLRRRAASVRLRSVTSRATAYVVAPSASVATRYETKADNYLGFTWLATELASLR